MKYSKKALQTHIIILGFVSIVMTALIMSVFSSFFQNDHPNCQNFEFEVANKCIDGNALKVNVKNTGNSLLNFKTDDAFSRKYEIPISSSQKMDFNSKGADKIILIPYYKDIQGKEYDCKGKSVEIQLGRLIKCSN